MCLSPDEPQHEAQRVLCMLKSNMLGCVLLAIRGYKNETRLVPPVAQSLATYYWKDIRRAVSWFSHRRFTASDARYYQSYVINRNPLGKENLS